MIPLTQYMHIDETKWVMTEYVLARLNDTHYRDTQKIIHSMEWK